MKLRIFLVVASCVVSLITGFVISRTGSSTESIRPRAKPLIGLSMDTLKEERWQGDRDLFVTRARELGADVLVQSANSDDTRQISDVQALISRRVDVLVIVPHNGGAMAKADNIALLYKRGQDKVLTPLIDGGEIEVVHEDWTQDWKPENAKKIASAAITKAGANFDAILASNDGTAGGAIQALSEEGLAGKILVTGQDAELSACQRIANGTQAMTIYKPLSQLAKRAAEAATKIARSKPVFALGKINNGQIDVPSILLDVVVVTKENMMDTIVKDGFHKAAEVSRSLPEAQQSR